MTLSLCTFTPFGGSPINLGTHDAWVKITPGETADLYEVTCNYVDSSGLPIMVSGAQRATAEVYLRDLANALGLTQLYARQGPLGKVLIPRDTAVSGHLANPYTSLALDGCFLTDIKHSDDGRRYYGFVATFTKPRFDTTVSPFNVSDVTFGGTSIGNVGGFWKQAVDAHFAYYNVQAQYNGPNMRTYLATLADALGFDEAFTVALPRGAKGNRGIVKAPVATPATLAWTSRGASVQAAYIVNMSGDETDAGLLDIGVNFVVPR